MEDDDVADLVVQGLDLHEPLRHGKPVVQENVAADDGAHGLTDFDARLVELPLHFGARRVQQEAADEQAADEDGADDEGVKFYVQAVISHGYSPGTLLRILYLWRRAAYNSGSGGTNLSMRVRCMASCRAGSWSML